MLDRPHDEMPQRGRKSECQQRHAEENQAGNDRIGAEVLDEFLLGGLEVNRADALAVEGDRTNERQIFALKTRAVGTGPEETRLTSDPWNSRRTVCHPPYRGSLKPPRV